MTVLVDSNVLLDLVTDSAWANWSAKQIEGLSNESLAINQLIYAEVSYSFRSAGDLDVVLGRIGFDQLNLPWEAAFPAAQAFLRYRRAGGAKSSPLPDFYIGAHALVSNLTLLTRDAGRYRTYFPEVQLIAP